MTVHGIKHIDRKQSGVVVVLFLVLLAVSAYASFRLTTSPDGPTAQKSRMAELLAAKQALIAYAVTYADNYGPAGAGYGHFPCPDHDLYDDLIDTNDGPDPPCTKSNFGRLPRYTSTKSGAGFKRKLLEFHMLKTLIDEPLWYAISSTYINNPLNRKVNPDTQGEFSVDSSTNIVAVVVSPGSELRALGQARPSNRLRDYMEHENAIINNHFSRYPLSRSNDLLVTIRSEEFMPLVQNRVAGFLTKELREFWRRHCGSGESCYPSAVMGKNCVSGLKSGYLPIFSEICTRGLAQDGFLEQVIASKHWYVRNGWSPFIRYTRDPACIQDLTGQCVITSNLDNGDQRFIDIEIGPAVSSS